jgi:hypothetical protein
MDEFFRSDLFKAVAAAVVAGVLLKLVWPLLFRPKADGLSLRVRCSLCGWKGTVGKYNRKCAKCASTTLENLK